MKQRLFLGVDGGQSSTRAIVGDEKGRVIGFGRGGPSNHSDQPGAEERLRSAVCDSVSEAVRPLGCSLQTTRFDAAYFGMTGGPQGKLEPIRRWINSKQLQVEQDTCSAWAGALEMKPGVVTLAGTGSVVFACDENGRSITVGGFGYVFGDEGSAFGLSRAALVSALAAEQGWKDEAKALRSALLDWFQVASADEIRHRFYAGQISRDRFASFAQKLLLLSAEDPEAEKIVTEAAAALARLALRAHQVLPLNRSLFSGTGGALTAPPVWDRFAGEIQKKLPSAEIQRPRWPPVVGALLLAYRMVSATVPQLTIDPVIRANLGEVLNNPT